VTRKSYEDSTLCRQMVSLPLKIVVVIVPQLCTITLSRTLRKLVINAKHWTFLGHTRTLSEASFDMFHRIFVTCCATGQSYNPNKLGSLDLRLADVHTHGLPALWIHTIRLIPQQLITFFYRRRTTPGLYTLVHYIAYCNNRPDTFDGVTHLKTL